MANLNDAALAAHQAKDAEWVTKGKERLRPVFTDNTKSPPQLVLDPIGKTEEVHRDEEACLLVLHTIDGSDRYFAVCPDDPDKPVTMVEPADPFGFTGFGNSSYPGPAVSSLADVGEVLAEANG